jgi:hypothetical protein
MQGFNHETINRYLISLSNCNWICLQKEVSNVLLKNPYVLIRSHIIASYIWFLIVVPGRVPLTMWSRLQFPMKLIFFCFAYRGIWRVGIPHGHSLHISYHSVTTNCTIAITTIGNRHSSVYKLIFSVIRAVNFIVHPGFYVDPTVIRVINGNTITKINHVAVVDV